MSSGVSSGSPNNPQLVESRKRLRPKDKTLSGGDQLRKLLLVELEVVPALAQELVVTAALDDPTRIQHQDFVGGADGRQPVRDDQRCAASEQLVQRLLYEQLRL